MYNNDCENSAPQYEERIKELVLENKKLSRELRITQNYLEKTTRMLEAKEALGNTLSIDNAKQKAYTDMLLESCPNIIFLLDENRQFVLSTKMFLTVGGMHNFDFIKGNVYDEFFEKHMSSEVIARLREAVDTVIIEKKNITLSEWIDFSGTGDMRYYSIELMSIGGNKSADVGITSGVLAVFIDLTDIMREKERSEAANDAKSNFLATMSHEIRTPMNAILGIAEVMSRGELTPEQQKYIVDIKTSSHSLLAIINDLLDFSKIEAGKLDVINSSYNIKYMLENLRSMFALMFVSKNLRFSFVVESSVPDTACGDENRLRQVLTNILSNALKYTSAGCAAFTARFDGNSLIFEVFDTGIGIRDEDKPRLFLPFEQLDIRKNKNIVGTGLGLAISYRLCKLMGGELSFKSIYGEGSAFTISIPYIPADKDVLEREDDKSLDFTAPGARVLIVDDIELNLVVAEAMLKMFDITPDLAESGKAAIQLIRAKTYDLILMDHMMPEMDGIEATHRIRTMGGWCEKVPVVALTANAINGVEQMFLSNRFDGFIPKPLEISALNSCLRKHLPEGLIREN